MPAESGSAWDLTNLQRVSNTLLLLDDRRA
jgi:hypothetical protein